MLKKLDDVLTLDTVAVEALSPFHEFSLGEADLLTREGEGEAERQDLLVDLPVLDEVGQAGGNVVEQLGPGPYECH